MSEMSQWDKKNYISLGYLKYFKVLFDQWNISKIYFSATSLLLSELTDSDSPPLCSSIGAASSQIWDRRRLAGGSWARIEDFSNVVLVDCLSQLFLFLVLPWCTKRLWKMDYRWSTSGSRKGSGWFWPAELRYKPGPMPQAICIEMRQERRQTKVHWPRVLSEIITLLL